MQTTEINPSDIFFVVQCHAWRTQVANILDFKKARNLDMIYYGHVTLHIQFNVNRNPQIKIHSTFIGSSQLNTSIH